MPDEKGVHGSSDLESGSTAVGSEVSGQDVRGLLVTWGARRLDIQATSLKSGLWFDSYVLNCLRPTPNFEQKASGALSLGLGRGADHTYTYRHKAHNPIQANFDRQPTTFQVERL